MFTGIVETTGRVEEIITAGTNRIFWIGSAISSELKVDQSVGHSGACLTVDGLRTNAHRVTAVDETLAKTNLGSWHKGSLVNLERCLHLDGRVEGHLVQGHVDATGNCINRIEKDGSWEFEFEFSKKFAPLMIEKGSIAVNGISLTAFAVRKKKFKVAIIPFTFEHTNIQLVQPGETVNLEFDMIGKYVQRLAQLK